MTTSVTIDRSGMSGSLADLVIGAYPTDFWWLDQAGLSRPQRTMRRTYAESIYADGAIMVAASLVQSSLPLTVYVGGATWEWVDTRATALERALRQFVYTVTVTVDDVDTDYTADPADITWDAIEPGMVQGFMARATVTIPVFPLGG